MGERVDLAACPQSTLACSALTQQHVKDLLEPPTYAPNEDHCLSSAEGFAPPAVVRVGWPAPQPASSPPGGRIEHDWVAICIFGLQSLI